MFAIVMLVATVGPAQCPPPAYGFGFGGGSYAHGYGKFRPTTSGCCGIVLPPSWHGDTTSWEEGKMWYDYAMQLEGYERDDMMNVWQKATPEARRVLLAKLAVVERDAAIYRAKVEKDRNEERLKAENRPLSEEEREYWRAYLGKLKDQKKKDTLAKWKAADNRGKRLMLKEIIREMEEKDDE